MSFVATSIYVIIVRIWEMKNETTWFDFAEQNFNASTNSSKKTDQVCLSQETNPA